MSCTNRDISSCLDNGGLRGGWCIGVAVSYTHLDVYKRQTLTNEAGLLHGFVYSLVYDVHNAASNKTFIKNRLVHLSCKSLNRHGLATIVHNTGIAKGGGLQPPPIGRSPME